MSGPQVGGGKVELELDGKTFQLVPSVEACIELSRFPGGLVTLVQRCNQLDFACVVDIVGIGIEMGGRRLNPSQREKMLPKAVYEAGVVGVASKCVEFVSLIMNGGRPVEEDEADEEVGDEPPLELAT